jgi:hypothetical protein
LLQVKIATDFPKLRQRLSSRSSGEIDFLAGLFWLGLAAWRWHSMMAGPLPSLAQAARFFCSAD